MPPPDTSQRSNNWLPLLGLIACSGILGSAHVFARLTYQYDVGVATAAAARLSCAAVFVLVYLYVRGVGLPSPARAYRATWILGLLACGQTVGLQIAVLNLPATIAILFFYTFPFFTGVGSALMGDEPLTLKLVLALLAAFFGLALVTGVDFSGISLVGVAGSLVASIFFTLTLILTPRLAPELTAPQRTFFMTSLAAVILIVYLLTTGEARFPNSSAGWVPFVIFMTLYGVGINGVFMLLPKLGATQTAVALNLEPVLVAIVAYFVVGEVLGPLEMVGALIVVGSVMAYQVSVRKR